MELERRMNKYACDRLVKLELPAFECAGGTRRLEITENGEDWRRGELKKVAADGRVFVTYDDAQSEGQWLDLTRQRYRWLR